ncbi:MAG: hypothetical protein L6R35_003478, partial [Caloplaca aegaea]
MVIWPVPLKLAYIDLQGLEYQPHCNHSSTESTQYWSTVDVHSMADEMFDHGYTGGPYQDPSYQNMSNMQRFLEEKETYFAGRRVYDGKQPHFNGEKLSSAAVGYYDAPQPWPQQLHIPHSVYPQELISHEWTLSDPDSCSASTGKTWSPRASESCPDQDPRYPSWPAPHMYQSGFAYPNYNTNLTQEAGLSSPRSITGALSEIQQCPDNEVECVSMKGGVQVSDHGCPASTTDRATRTAHYYPDEGLRSPVHGSATDSPLLQDDNTAMESVSGDGEGDGNGDGDGDSSDYSPQSRSNRTSRTQKARTKSQSKESRSPPNKRSSLSKSDPHQLTTPAKIIKRTSTQSKPNLSPSSSTSPHASQTPNPNDSVCTDCQSAFPSVSGLQKHILSAHTRPFICSFRQYGCTSRFGSKNEWKRHVSSQHLCPGIYRCDIGPCVPRPPPASPPNRKPEHRHQTTEFSPNDFNRKDLFTQHLRRMHAPAQSASRAAKDAFTSSLEAVRRRCWIHQRETPPRSICPYCAPHPSRPSPPAAADGSAAKKKATKPVVFEGKGSWDERMEHVGRHLEKEGEDLGVEVEDVGLREWMVGEGLVAWEKAGWVV